MGTVWIAKVKRGAFLSWVACLAIGTNDARADNMVAWPDLGKPAAVRAEGAKDAALIVAVEKYAFVASVDGAVSNGRDWYRYLVDGRKVPMTRVHFVRDNDGSRESVLAEAQKAASEVEAGGTLWFVFVGHGAPAKDGDGGVLVGVDAQQNATSLEARSLKHAELREVFHRGKQSHVVEVLDACFSGQGSNGSTLVPGLQPLLLAGALKSLETDSVVSLAAGTSDQFAGPLPHAKRPAFSYLVLGALRGWGDSDGDGAVTAEEAVAYANRVLAMAPLGRTQTPTVSGSLHDFALSHGGTEREPDLTAIFADADGGAVVGTAVSGGDRAPTTVGSAQRGWAWASIAAGAVGLGAASYFAIQSSSAADRFKAQCGGDGTGSCTDTTAALGAFNEAKDYSTYANVAMYGGGGLLALGALLWATSPRPEPNKAARIIVAPNYLGFGGDY